MTLAGAELSGPYSAKAELVRAHARILELENRITGLQAEIIEHQRAALAGMRGVLELPDIRNAAMGGTNRTRDMYLGALAQDFGRTTLERLRHLEANEGNGATKALLAQAWLEGAAKMRTAAAKIAETFAEKHEDGTVWVSNPEDIATDIRALSLVPFEEEGACSTP